MAYTIVGMFPTIGDANNASERLNQAGFPQEDFKVSRFTTTGEYDGTKNYEFEEDEKTTGFWNWLFGDDEDEKKKYSYAGTKSNLLTLYTNDISQAEKARDIMNEEGAINVNEFTKDRYKTAESTVNLSEKERARIIAKAKNNLYLTDENRFYNARNEGMESDMDSQGSRDTF